MSQYFGPAGIFSTDNPVSDTMQIEAEQGPWDEEDLFWEDEYPTEDVLYAGCSKCTWWSSTIYWVGDQVDFNYAKEELRKKHKTEYPDCDGQIGFG